MHRSGVIDPALRGVAETLLIPLYNGAMESPRPDALMKDTNPWIAPIFRLIKPMRIFHFQLGKAAG